MPRTGKRNERVGQVLEQASLGHPDPHALFGIRRAAAVTIEPGCARRRYLGHASRTNVNGERKAVTCQHSARYVVQVNQRASIDAAKGADYSPRRLLRIHEHARAPSFALKTKREVRG